MERLRGASLLLVSLLLSASGLLSAQNSDQPKTQPAPSVPSPQAQVPAPPIDPHAPHMSKQTRFEIIRVFETQIVYAKTSFPMGTKGLSLRSGAITPSGQELQQLLALWGPSVRPGDPAHISYVQIKDDHIHFDLNGGAVHRKKWYEHIQVSGASGAEVPLSPNQSQQNPHGTYLDVYFDKYVPEMTAQQLRDVLVPVLDFNAKNKEEAYLDTVPPKVKEAIQAHHVLVGMNSEMVVHAMGKAPKKVREKDGDTDYEEWIYGDPPRDVDFVRIVGDELARRVAGVVKPAEQIVEGAVFEHDDHDVFDVFHSHGNPFSSRLGLNKRSDQVLIGLTVAPLAGMSSARDQGTQS